MDAMGEIEIRLEGFSGKEKLRPEHVDIGVEMDRNSLEFIELFDYDTSYSDRYLDKLMKKAAPAWESIKDPDAWLEDLRDGAYA